MMVCDGDGSGAHLMFAYYITAHGFGHATRALEVVRPLLAMGHDVHVVTATPEFTSENTSPRLHICKVEQVVLDCGTPNTLTVDYFTSLEKYYKIAVVLRESMLRSEAKWLKSIEADIVVLDVGSAEDMNESAESSSQLLAYTMPP